MHSKVAVLAILASSSIPVLSAPVSLGSLGAELGKGLAVGGGLAGLGALADHFLEGDSSASQSQKRQISEQDIALLKRAVALGSLGLCGDIVACAGMAGPEALPGGFLGAGDSQDQSQKREWTSLEARQLGKLLGTAAEDTIGDVLKKGLVNGAGAAVGGSVVGGLISEFTGNNNQKRHHKHKHAHNKVDTSKTQSAPPSPASTTLASPSPLSPDSVAPPVQKRQLGKLLGTAAEDTIGDVLKKGLVNGAGAVVGGSVVGGLISEFTGNDNQKRHHKHKHAHDKADAPTAQSSVPSPASTSLRSPIPISPPAGLDPLASTAHKRQLGKLLGTAAEDTIGDVLKKGLVNGAGSAVGGAVVGGLIHEFTDSNNNKREPIEIGPIGTFIAGHAASLGASTIVGDGIDKIEGLFDGNSNSNDKREPFELGTVGKGLLGTAASLGASALVGDGIDKIEGLFGGNSNSKREASLDDLD